MILKIRSDNMIKNRYKAYGKNINEEIFNGTCIAESIIGAINLFNDNYLSVEKIEKVQQTLNTFFLFPQSLTTLQEP